MPPNIYSVITTLCSIAGAGMFAAILNYFKTIKNELTELRIRDAQNKTILDSHSKEFSAIWQKFKEVDSHIEHTDKALNQHIGKTHE